MWFSYAFVIALSGAIILQWWLNQRQLRHIARFRAQVPEAFADRISLAAHQKAADYTSAKVRLGQLELLYSSALLLLWTLGGGLDWLDSLWSHWLDNSLWHGVAFVISMMIIGSLLDLPFSIYRTFVIETRYGFNRTKPLLFVSDLIKGMMLTLAIGTPLLWVVLWLMESAGALWWVYVWAVWMGFSLLMMFVYPTWIAPLFNKFAPLEDAALRTRIEQLLQRCGFTSKGIFIMDGSKRSSHGNAYFTGLGDNKRIVFFDTLLKSLQADEIEAVLAHELGHFKRKHIQKQVIAMAVMTFISLAVLGLLVQQDWFFAGLGIQSPSMHAALVLFILLMSVLGVYVQPLFSYFSRRHEFEADDFAASQSDARDLIRALVKLYEENASTLTPDPLYSAFHDSHPPAPVRIAHLSTKIPV
ncbi:MAG: M48 family metalloprotease [Gammaproteobacteria bacterium]|nr:M48 family metalloprotease [Gammaproteobacteria bacterium]